MRKFLFVLLLAGLSATTLNAQKLSKDERAKLTPDQRIVYDNSTKKTKSGERKKQSMKKKVKQAKKEDRKSRRIKQPKNPYIKKKPKK